MTRLSIFIATLGFSAFLSAQTVGTLTFTFMPIAKSPCYQGTQSALAAWIQTNTGAFVKTKLAYAGCCATCGNTQDHVPTWSSNAGGATTDCLNANVTDATTGATLPNFSAKSFVWDGKNVSGTVNGTTVADGIYKVAIQETWNHGSTSTAMTTYTFTKGPAVDHRTITGDANFGNILINWQPATTIGINEATSVNPVINVYPNPTEGVFNVDFKNATNIKVLNTLGAVIYEEKIEQLTEGTKNIDLSNFTNGIYFVNVSNGTNSSNHKIILNK
jgi:hypothetical protein